MRAALSAGSFTTIGVILSNYIKRSGCERRGRLGDWVFSIQHSFKYVVVLTILD
jgi:hypothetical protein